MITQLMSTWVAEGTKLFGEHRREWRFKCPSCGNVATPAQIIEAGGSADNAPFICIGRVKPGVGCDWTAGGLFGTLGKGRIVRTTQGNDVELFDFDTDEASVVDELAAPVYPGADLESWDEFVWEDWVPERVRQQVKEFWSQGGRNPKKWAKSAVEQRAPAFGATLNMRPIGGGEAIGRFVFMWNNIGRLVQEDGTVVTVSF